MKLRQKPEDFIVEEIPNKEWKTKGKYTIYKLTKTNMTTFAAEKVLAKQCNINFKQIGFAGLKDTHAITTQYFSVEKACGDFKEQNVKAEIAGYLDEPLKTGDLAGNKFKITIKELREREIYLAEKNLEQVKKGVPNYFDSQRFGSLRGTDDFIAKDVLKGNYEAAIKKIITATTKHTKTKKLRQFIKAHWENWEKCLEEIEKKQMQRTAEGTIIKHLAETNDYKGAFRKTYKGIREIFFSAFQSYIWNECIKQMITGDTYQIIYEAGKLKFSRDWKPIEGTFPLAAPEVKNPLIEKVLKKTGMKLEDFQTDEHKFVARERAITVKPENLEMKKEEDKIILEFYLPKGSYATIIIKALFEN